MGNGVHEVGGGASGDIALFGRPESLRSRVSSEVSTSIGVVLRGVRWLQIGANLNTRRSVDFDFTETAGGQEFHLVTAGL